MAMALTTRQSIREMKIHMVYHFKQLLNIEPTNCRNGFLDYVGGSLPLLEEGPQPNEIPNKAISQSEVLNSIKKLKNGKTPGLDPISNEMLKCATSPI